MTINHDVLFARIGHWCKVAQDLDGVAGAALVTNVRAAEEDLDTEQHDFQQAVLGSLEQTLDSGLSTLGSLMQQLAGDPIQRLIVETVHLDTPLLNKSIEAALAVLLDQMDDEAESLDASTPGWSVDYGENSSSAGTGDNYGNGVLVCCTQRGDGRVNEFILAETIRCEITSVSNSGTATWTLVGEPLRSALHPEWPGGSGTSRTITSVVAASSNLVPNGDMEDEDQTADDLPDRWIAAVGTLGTDIQLTPTEQQTVTINGGPLAGHYTLTFTDRWGELHATIPLARDATASTVQAALRSLPGLASVTVTATGTSPNYTHTVVFENVPNPAQLTSTSLLTGGSPTITHATLVAGSPYVARGSRCLELVGDGATLTCLQVPINLTARTCYAFNLWAAVDVVPAAGVLTVDLVDGVGGTVVADDQGNNNTLAIDLTGLSATHSPHNVCFHTPLAMPSQVYLRVRLTTALSAGTSLFLDELAMVAMQELYAGGLWAAAFSGPNDFLPEDCAEIVVTNDRAGELHEFLNRFLGLQSRRVLFPTEVSGSQPDTLIQ
jgi:hypothetical protein